MAYEEVVCNANQYVLVRINNNNQKQIHSK
jgi:hypothetical protein